MRLLACFAAEQDGATAIEYSLIAALFSVACISAYWALSDALVSLFTTVSTQLNAASTTN
jgi:Flp pilus assembly pilin Flp